MRSSEGELAVMQPRLPLARTSGIPRTGQFMGIAMSASVSLKGMPSRLARARAATSMAFSGFACRLSLVSCLRQVLHLERGLPFEKENSESGLHSLQTE